MVCSHSTCSGADARFSVLLSIHLGFVDFFSSLFMIGLSKSLAFFSACLTEIFSL